MCPTNKRQTSGDNAAMFWCRMLSFNSISIWTFLFCHRNEVDFEMVSACSRQINSSNKMGWASCGFLNWISVRVGFRTHIIIGLRYVFAPTKYNSHWIAYTWTQNKQIYLVSAHWSLWATAIWFIYISFGSLFSALNWSWFRLFLPKTENTSEWR